MVTRMPLNNALVVLFRRHKVPENRMFQSFLHRRNHRWHGWKTHVRDPHRNHIEAFLRSIWRLPWNQPQPINSQRVHSTSVIFRCKIKFHPQNLLESPHHYTPSPASTQRPPRTLSGASFFIKSVIPDEKNNLR